MSNNLPAETELVNHYREFREYVNAHRVKVGFGELGDIEMVTAYSICQEFWNERKQAVIRAKLWKLL